MHRMESMRERLIAEDSGDDALAELITEHPDARPPAPALADPPGAHREDHAEQAAQGLPGNLPGAEGSGRRAGGRGGLDQRSIAWVARHEQPTIGPRIKPRLDGIEHVQCHHHGSARSRTFICTSCLAATHAEQERYRVEATWSLAQSVRVPRCRPSSMQDRQTRATSQRQAEMKARHPA